MSDELPNFHVTVSREENLWVAVVDGLSGGATDVEHFDELEDAVGDLIASLTETEVGDFVVKWRYKQAHEDLTELG